MTIPRSNEIIRPMLEYLARNEEPVKLAILAEFLGKKFEITEEERKEKLGGGGNFFRTRINIAVRKMKSSRLISSPERGYFEITEKGREHVGDISPPVQESVNNSLNPPLVEEAQDPRADAVVSDSGDDKFFQEIVKLYLMKNEVKPEQLPSVLEALRTSLNVQQPTAPRPRPRPSTPSPTRTTSQEPAVPVEESVTNDYIICLECGKTFTSLKRHLGSHHLTTPEKYREKWGLPPDYPMITTKASERRAQTAKNIGLGQMAQAAKSKREKTA